jgi:antitoxin ParD1/3/4
MNNKNCYSESIGHHSLEVCPLNISLTPELEQFVQAQVQSGMYHSASEVIREGLRLLKRLNPSPQEVKDWYNTQIADALNEASRGETLSGEASYQLLQSKLKSLRPDIP